VKKIKSFLICVLGTLAVGFLAGALSGDFSAVYENIRLPALAPPGIVFPIVWTVLYILMGISVFLIYDTGKPEAKKGISLYIRQLIVNFLWPIVFFRTGWFFAAFILILLLWLLILSMIMEFYRQKKAAAYLLIPYFLWTTFAAYLNLAVYILNK